MFLNSIVLYIQPFKSGFEICPNKGYVHKEFREGNCAGSTEESPTAMWSLMVCSVTARIE